MNITLISVGNGGYNLASDLIKANVFPGAQFIVCDTDASLLEKNRATASKSFLLEKTNRKLSSQDLSDVDEVLADTADTVVVCATLGGKCGSTYAPLVALNAILQGKKVFSIVTLPSEFEGEDRVLRAAKTKAKVITASDSTLMQHNEQLNQIDGLQLNDMNKPVVDTMLAALQTYSQTDLMEIRDAKLREALIPTIYRIDGNPLLELKGPISFGITPESRKEVFDSFK